MSIIRASAQGDLAQVKKMLAEGADCNVSDSKGRTALIEAAWGGFLEIVKALVKQGADVNCSDLSGFTPLMRAVEDEHLAVVEFLIQKGANLNTFGKVRGSTPLMLAAEKGSVKLIELLLEHGAKINASDQFEETALARAYRNEQLKAITLLESKGATRKPERNLFAHSEKEARPVIKATIPKWSAAAEDEDVDLDDDESALVDESIDDE